MKKGNIKEVPKVIHFNNNPRVITKRQFDKLQDTMEEYGDLSVIVLNIKENEKGEEVAELIGGNQRTEAGRFINKKPVITERFDPPTKQGTIAVGYYVLGGERFNVRVVKWGEEKALKANIIANAAGGSFDVEALANIDTTILLDAGLDDEFMAGAKNISNAISEMIEAHEGGDQSGVDTTKRLTSRKMPLDMIFTIQGADASCCLAVHAGWKYGINSGQFRLCPYTHYFSGKHEVAFVDNDYFNYKHEKHLETVKIYKPKYCTVRDIMTEEQCRRDNITWYPLEQILEWAEELQEYAENVILIPKYDCIDQIPEKFMLGYSIPTSHGGTPLPVDVFRGHRVHLLGGSWANQLSYLEELGEDVASLDNNHVMQIAGFAQVEVGNGDVVSIKDITPNFDVNNPRWMSLALSFGAMAKHMQNTMEIKEDGKQ